MKTARAREREREREACGTHDARTIVRKVNFILTVVKNRCRSSVHLILRFQLSYIFFRLFVIIVNEPLFFFEHSEISNP